MVNDTKKKLKVVNEYTPLKNMSIFFPSKTIVDRYILTLGFIYDMVVLDFGCGCGHGCAFMLAYGAKKAYGFDTNKNALIESKYNYGKKFNKDYIEFVDNLNKIEENSIDLITSFEVFEHIKRKDLDYYITKIRRLLKSDGMLILSIPFKESKYLEKDNLHVNIMSLLDIDYLMKTYFGKKYIFLSTTNPKFPKEKGWMNTALFEGISDDASRLIIIAKK